MSEQDRQTQIDNDLRTARRTAHDAARHALTCAECGTEDGLVGWTQENILEFIENDKKLPNEFYIIDDDNERLYTRCPTCGGATTEVLSKCTLLTAADIAAWVLKDECTCNDGLGIICPVCDLQGWIEAEWRQDR
jgi:ribosomal protein S14